MKTAIPIITNTLLSYYCRMKSEKKKNLGDTRLFVRNDNISINRRRQKRIKDDKSDLVGKISGTRNNYATN